ncbi:MAG TPA: cytochrome c biogenesis protein ResB [Methylophilaceae bacterium]|jgi:cytochrome c biogenesis protein|nr:cytochrome c biogenesis protein ResB [Methylophilaceae bacterium]
MRFAISLLTVLGIASIIGTVLKQNEPYPNYVVQFGQFWFGMFETLGLYDVYHTAWFLLILVFLVLSTSLCIYRNTPSMLHELRTFREHATEKSLRNFNHKNEYFFSAAPVEVIKGLGAFLAARGFRFRTVPQSDGSTLLAAKAGSYQRLGYILTHSAIVVICIGGLMDGNVPLKVQELLGYKAVESRDIPETEVPEKSRLSTANLSFRANMTLPEGAQGNVAFMRVRDGYLVQELPFSVVLKDFRIAHYATGQPKSFESDVEILDKDLKEPLKATIRVNHPLVYKGIAIYQSDFQDGGSRMDFNVWPLRGADHAPATMKGRVFDNLTQGEGQDALTVELDDFRLFNILNLSADGKGKPRNVGPSVTFKVRDAQGQAREYINYMQPLTIGGRPYFVSGVRGAQNEDFNYLRIPADGENSLGDFMRLRAVMFDASLAPKVAKRLSSKALQGQETSAELRDKFEGSTVRLLKAFAEGGYTQVAKLIEESVPEKEREKAAITYLKIIANAAYEGLALSRERAGLPAPQPDESTQQFVHETLNSMSDVFFYGTPFYLEMTQFEQMQASGFQLTRSPGQNLVYGGSVLLVLGIFAMIYLRERRIWLLVKPESQSVLFAMSSNRKNRDFEFEYARHSEQLQTLFKG